MYTDHIKHCFSGKYPYHKVPTGNNFESGDFTNQLNSPHNILVQDAFPLKQLHQLQPSCFHLEFSSQVTSGSLNPK